ncbi:trehalose-phosphatase [Cellulomonas shaoxiangyii]|uniref:Trehalose 6-phosphate phosphatase n=1 Tax=Cellulomonas shaoxiangyii TaxID=2566013 RepID=A0A4P7SMV5_9CELL|nr:trehalose-phosphatase [Cellulomonas shaoxiangyii]QCB94586.1 trehalose-phosphatase [Cellulomonas shaoxiangyii]TGY85008.1 trehalose-phosphatase [Cellulomonas shaoxiangyii]
MTEPTPTTGGPAGPPDAAPQDAHALAQRLEEVLADAGRRPVLLALDFDGTLSPLVDDPASSAILPAGVEVLAALGGRDGIALALVSGRAMADLHALAAVPPGTYLVGSHGAERARVTTFGLERDVVELTSAQADRLASLGARAAAVARGRDGVWVETKPTAVVVHTRLAERDVAGPAEQEALALGAELGAGTLHGKDVVELTVLPADKGSALAALRRELGAPVVLYAGDDVTDEHAFAALGPDDLTVKVGAGATAARYRVDGPQDVVAALAVVERATR